MPRFFRIKNEIEILFFEKDFNQKNVRFQQKKPSIKSKLLKTYFMFLNA